MLVTEDVPDVEETGTVATRVRRKRCYLPPMPEEGALQKAVFLKGDSRPLGRKHLGRRILRHSRCRLKENLDGNHTVKRRQDSLQA